MKKKKYKVWVEYEEVIEARTLAEALEKFEKNFNLKNIDFNGCELK
jgi:hypothetical protein